MENVNLVNLSKTTTNWLEGFCSEEDGRIWDLDQLWNTPRPEFSRCFQQIVPIWFPSLLLWIAAPVQIYQILNSGHRKKPPPIPYNLYNVTRFSLVSAIILVNTVCYSYEPDFIGSLINVFTYVLFGYLLNLHRVHAIHTSALAWIFIFTALLLQLPSLYMHVFFEQRSSHSDLSHNPHSSYLFFTQFISILILFILTCVADDTSPPSPSDEFTSPTTKECPSQRASFLSRITFWWFNSLPALGYRKTLKLEDLWDVNECDATQHIGAVLEKTWDRHQKANSGDPKVEDETKKKGSIGSYFEDMKDIFRVWKILVGIFGWNYVLGTALELADMVINFAEPMLLKYLLNFISNTESSQPVWHGYLIACLFYISSIFQKVFALHARRLLMTSEKRVRNSLTSLIYRKALTSAARKSTSSGEVINMMTTDVRAVEIFVTATNDLWMAPIQIAIAMYLLWLELGHADLVGILVAVGLVPLNFWMSSVQKRSSKLLSKKTDERVKVINELLGGIRVIKMYGWEVPFARKVTAIRDEELVEIKKGTFISQISHFIWTCAPFIVSLATFSIYLLNADQSTLDSKKVFVSMSLFGLLRSPLTKLPQMFKRFSKASVAVKRLNGFFGTSSTKVGYVTRAESKDSVTIKSGTFAWDEKDRNPALSDVNLKVPKGSLVAIVGQVGSGKSSLLSAILGDMERIDGSVNVDRSESMAYVAQQAWIQNATLRSNILFGSEFDQNRYDAIIEMCALSPDIAILPGGDQTEIGEKGINLSGGQKQRVAIARACYSSASLVLLDDPLSAVDSHVAKHIFRKVLSNASGYLRDRTRILVTNNISILPEVDQIIILEDGKVVEEGSYKELLTASGKLSDLVQKHKLEPESDDDESIEEPSKESIKDEPDDTKPESSAQPKDTSKAKLITPETVKSDAVDLSKYLKYFRSMSYTCLAAFAFFAVIQQLCRSGSKVWLAIWSSNNPSLSTQSEGQLTKSWDRGLTTYGILGFGHAIFYMIGEIFLINGTIKSSISFHQNLLDRLLRLPMSFFDTTPVGRVVNVFHGDIATIDHSFPSFIGFLFTGFLGSLANFIHISWEMPQFFLAVVPVFAVTYCFQNYSKKTSRQLARLAHSSRSPVLSQFQETLAGVSTIRAFGAMPRFVRECSAKIDTNSQAWYHHMICSLWNSMYMDMCGNLVDLAMAMLAVYARDQYRHQPGVAALVLNQSFMFIGTLRSLISLVQYLESSFVSVERIDEYCEKKPEAEWVTPQGSQLPDGWPQKGEIEFANYSVRYREGLDLVLKDLSLKIEAGEKVGVVGRTGAGKSSLTLALFRILEADQGHIAIDDVPIEAIGLHELREKLSIIPQDPVLFSGTIRSNLDPFGLYRDELLLDALSHCHMRQYIESTELGLDHAVAENGSNLSVGQRQLICLGRALLRRTKILVLDEATAAIDLETDSLIQETIRREFAHCTILTIAHRLNTILDSDRVLVLDQGQMMEFDSPSNLLSNQKSMFYSLAKDAKLV